MKRDFALYILLISLATVPAFVICPGDALAEDAGPERVLEPLSEVKRPAFETSGEISRGHRDPFMPPEHETETTIKPSVEETDMHADIIKDMRLSAIMRGNGSEKAIINGYIVRAGDRIREFYIERIEKDRVVMKADKKEYILTLDSLVPGRFSDERGE